MKSNNSSPQPLPLLHCIFKPAMACRIYRNWWAQLKQWGRHNPKGGWYTKFVLPFPSTHECSRSRSLVFLFCTSVMHSRCATGVAVILEPADFTIISSSCFCLFVRLNPIGSYYVVSCHLGFWFLTALEAFFCRRTASVHHV